MKLKYTLLALAFTLPGFVNAFAQQSEYRKRVIDSHVAETPKNVISDVEQLTKYLTRPAVNDWERVRAIYMWITTNIEYDYNLYLCNNDLDYRSTPKKMKSFKNRMRYISTVTPIRMGLSKEQKYVTSKVVLKRRRALNDGIVALFNTMCRLSGVKSYEIRGYGKGGSYLLGDQFYETNHTWNIVLVDKKWEIVDPTWKHFMPDPEKSALTHLPADPKWQLLERVVPIEIFEKDSAEIARHFIGNKENIGKALLAGRVQNFNDSIRADERRSAMALELITAQKALDFNPNNHTDAADRYFRYATLLLYDSLPQVRTSMQRRKVMNLSMRYYEEAKNHLKVVSTSTTKAINTRNLEKIKIRFEDRKNDLDSIKEKVKADAKLSEQGTRDTVKLYRQKNNDIVAKAEADYKHQLDSLEKAHQLYLDSIRIVNNRNYASVSSQLSEQMSEFKAESDAKIKYLKQARTNASKNMGGDQKQSIDNIRDTKKKNVEIVKAVKQKDKGAVKEEKKIEKARYKRDKDKRADQVNYCEKQIENIKKKLKV